MAKVLKDLAQQSTDANQSRAKAEQLQQQAQNLLKNLSPQQQRELADLARKLNNGNPPQMPPNSPPTASRNDPGQGLGPMVPPRPRPQRDLDSVPTTPADFRAKDAPADDQRIIAEWDAAPKPGEAPAPSTAIDTRLRRAADGAERAIEQQNVPPRYSDLVRRVFKKYVDRANREPEPPK